MASKKEKNNFTYNGKTYSVTTPSHKVRRESDAVYAKAYRQAIQDGYFLEAEIEDILKSRGYVEKDANKKRNDLLRKIRSLEAKLVKQDFSDKESGREMALNVKDLRDELDSIDAPKNELTSQCANTIAENKRFSFFSYACVLDESGERLWDSFDDFEADESELAYKAATEVLSLIYEGNQVVVKGLEMQKYENKWLIENGFMDESLHYLDEKGNKVDAEGRLIDDDFNFIDTQGRKVDIFGNLIDDNGNIITEDETIVKKATSKKKVTKKKAATKKVQAAQDSPPEEGE